MRWFKLVFALSAWTLVIVAGVIQSLRIDGRVPAINLFSNGSTHYIKTLVENNDYNAAINQMQMDFSLRPHETSILENLGNLLGSQRRPLEARECFRDLVQRKPDDAEAHRLLGCTYLDTRQPDIAVIHLRKAIQLKPDFPKALDNLGIALAQLGQVREAEKYFAKAVAIDPDFEDARNNLELARRQLGHQPSEQKTDESP